MRNSDSLEKPKIKGIDEIDERFDEYLRHIYPKYGSSEWVSTDVPSTVKINKVIFKNQILQAFSDLHGPNFDCMWILDAHTEKDVLVNGEPRVVKSKTEPVYFSSQVFDKVNQMYDRKETGYQRSQFVSCVTMTMNFIEFSFNKKSSVYCVDVISRVQAYHNATKNHFKKIWTLCHEERDESVNSNRLLNEYMTPNASGKKLVKYKEYLDSDRNGEILDSLLAYADPESGIPTDPEWNLMGSTLLSVVQSSTGK